MKNCKNLIILFPPGAGGNHLSNIISIDPHFEQFFESSNYKKDFLLEYQKNSGYETHYSPHLNFHSPTMEENIDNLINNKKVNILHGHLGAFLTVKHLLDQLEDKIYIIFGLYGSDSPLGQRIIKHSNLVDNYFYFEQQSLYEKNIISRIVETNVNQIFTFPADALTTDSFDKIDQFTKSCLGIELPHECSEMHKIWFNKSF